MFTRPARPALIAAAAVLVLAACGASPASPAPTGSPIPPGGAGGPGSPSGEPGAVPTTPPGTTASPVASATAVPSAVGLLLEVTSEGGFISPAASIGALPVLVVDSDGRIYTPGAGAGASLVPQVDVRDTGPGGAATILAAIRAAGLDREATGGVAADTGSMVFAAVIDGTIIQSRFARGGPGGPGGPGTPGGSGGPGAAAFDLLARLQDPTVTWGSASAAARSYTPTGFRVFAAPGAPATSAAGDPAIAWPLATGLADFGSPVAPGFGVAGLRAGVVTGADAATLAAVLAGANPASTLTSGGKPYTLWIRPLLPDELGA